jgi:hypothetical protein
MDLFAAFNSCAIPELYGIFFMAGCAVGVIAAGLVMVFILLARELAHPSH